MHIIDLLAGKGQIYGVFGAYGQLLVAASIILTTLGLFCFLRCINK